jgi:hypothetical protein
VRGTSDSLPSSTAGGRPELVSLISVTAVHGRKLGAREHDVIAVLEESPWGAHGPNHGRSRSGWDRTWRALSVQYDRSRSKDKWTVSTTILDTIVPSVQLSFITRPRKLMEFQLYASDRRIDCGLNRVRSQGHAHGECHM